MSTLPGFPDPLEETPESDVCPLGCVDGQVFVGVKYAEHLADRAADREEEPDRWRERRAAFLNSTYPCRIHRQVEFHRWAGGHYEKTHDVRTCEECITALGGKAKARKMAALLAGDDPKVERARRDLDL